MTRQAMTAEERAKQMVGRAEACGLALRWLCELRQKSDEVGAPLGPAAMGVLSDLLRTPRKRTPQVKAAAKAKP